jgi:hypothetical protein
LLWRTTHFYFRSFVLKPLLIELTLADRPGVPELSTHSLGKESVERWPLPARPVPRQTAFALRIMGLSYVYIDAFIAQRA